MAKEGKQPKAVSVQNKSINSRISYMYQAAAFLATRSSPSTKVTEHTNSTANEALGKPIFAQQLSRQLLSDCRTVSLKMVIRLSPALKHTICKRCSSLLISGDTCTSEIENKSRGGKKPWADVLVQRCNSCGCERRFPLAAEKQKSRRLRVDAKNVANTETESPTTASSDKVSIMTDAMDTEVG